MPVQLRWSDFDANFHLRHSAYYDFGAMCRIGYLAEAGLNESVFREYGFGPVLFKEECVFRREIKLADQVSVTGELLSCRPNGTRFHIRHRFLKSDNTEAAVLNVWGDWIDFSTRKLLVPPAFLTEKMNSLPRHPEFNFA